ncbi:hypothetical protein Tco_1234738 [Tanacetum coccineum]
MESCPNISAITLDRYLSDHKPILLREVYVDYGPVPFRFYHYWFELEGFQKLVEDAWNDPNASDPNAISLDGVWIDSPSVVKNEFFTHFKNRFDHPGLSRLNLDMNFLNTLSAADQRDDMERFISKDEIKRTVWDYGLDSDSNIKNIVQVLECFFYASGLRINMQKSKLMGIAVEDDKVSQAAHSIGWLTFTTPFSYLGNKVGGMMSITQTWNKIVLNRMEVIRCRFINGVDAKEKRMTWVSWKNALASKDKGGLGVLSFYALNRSLMFKWVWRFRNDNNSLWVSVIKALHGENGSLGTSS